MQKKILIIGGYGSVGQIVAAKLGGKFPGQVIAAGRSYEKAKAFSEQSNGQVLPLAIDVSNNLFKKESLDGISLVIMCLDQSNTEFVNYYLSRGINYIDITANDHFFTAIEKLKTVATSNNSSAVLSVGLSPGITNLLAKLAKSAFTEISQLDIFILLGLGDAHGEAAIRWTLDNLNKDFTIIEKGRIRQVNSFDDGMRVFFPGIGYRMAYRFNFSDQQTIPRTLDIDSVSTRLAFDLDYASKSFSFLKKIGLLNLLSYSIFREALVKILKNFPLGSSQYVIKLRAEGLQDGKRAELEYSFSGEHESRGTALVTAQIAEELFQGSYPAGIFHIDELFDPATFITGLQERYESEFQFMAMKNGVWQEQ